MRLLAAFILAITLIFIVLFSGYAESLEVHATPPTVPAIHPGAISPVAGYSYEKAVEIIGSPDGGLSDYQVKFIVHRYNGIDNGIDVYLNGHSLSWPNDIRLVSAAGTQYPYWIESNDQDKATIWVNIADIPASPALTNISLYYGRANDLNASDGTSTFPFFDDFSGTSLDTATRWKGQPGSASVSNGMLSLTGNNKGNVLSKSTFGPGFALESRVAVTNTVNSDTFIGFCNTDPLVESYAGAFNTWQSSDWMYDSNFVHVNTGIPLSTDWIRLTSMRSTYGSSIGMINQAGHYVGKVDSNSDSICIHHYGNGATNVDWILVRKYTQDEPVVSIWSGETAILLPQAPQALSGYSWVKANTVQGSPDRALADYQVKYIIHRSDGVDSGQDVYLDGHSQSWPDDIRFATGTTGLSYWIESYDANMAVVWVKMDKIPVYPGSSPVSIYYGKPGDPGASNGTDTFVLFDDFNGSSVSGLWSNAINCSASESDGVLHLTNINVEGHLPTSKAYDFNNSSVAVRCRINQSGGSDHLIIWTEGDGMGHSIQDVIRGSQEHDCYIRDTKGLFLSGPRYFEDLDRNTMVWHRIESWKCGGSTGAFFRNEQTGLNTTLNAVSDYNVPAPLSIGGHMGVGRPNAVDYDWVYIRNYTTNEPRPGVWVQGVAPAVGQPQDVTIKPVLTTPTPTVSSGIAPIQLSMIDIVLIALILVIIMVLIGVLGLLVIWSLMKH